ncbi:hypothetical protein [Actinoalloteichus caeruleus]|uniref:hypothetical protein n=1 Tax=Actinoalloteichus cyanogriseus TaxID=2893586 RepID=UPI003BB90BE1
MRTVTPCARSWFRWCCPLPSPPVVGSSTAARGLRYRAAVLAVSLLVVSGAVAAPNAQSAAAEFVDGVGVVRMAAAPEPPSSTEWPLSSLAPPPPMCDPALLPQYCDPPDIPTSSTAPCSGEGCIPHPDRTAPSPVPPVSEQPEQEEPDSRCGLTNIGACITESIDAFFRGVVTQALNPLLELLSTTLLTTPTPEAVPRVGELWENSWQILLLSYGLLVLLAGIIVMSYQTLQTRHSVKELAPRLVVGFLAGALSLWVATKGIHLANALVGAIMGEGVEEHSAGEALGDVVLGGLDGGLWVIFIGIVFVAMLVALLITYVVRVALTIVLVVAAPLALMFHALPQTEGIAYWWWKAYAGCLAIQLGQSLTLITATTVFLTPGGFTLFGATSSGAVNLLVASALMYILFKIPFWVLASIRGGGGRSFVGSLVKGFLAYKTFGLLGGGSGGKGSRPRTPAGGGAGLAGGAARTTARTPLAQPTTSAAQHTGISPGVHRRRAAATTASASTPRSPRTPSGARGRQLALPLGRDWPENRPVLGRDGQYRLPFDVERVPSSPTASPSGAESRPRRGGVPRGQPALPFEPYQGNRPTRAGQYPLPLEGVRRTPRVTPSPPPPGRAARGRRVAQPELPVDPYWGNRPTRAGQYPLPLDGLRRARPPAPPPTSPSGSTPRTGRQLRLPLDLPGAARQPAPPPPPPSAQVARPRPQNGGRTS